MKVTVLLCTRNRPEIIESCILAILSNTYRDFELLIVDQSLDKKTQEIVERHMRTDKRITYIHMNAQGKTKALNLGIKESAGDIIAQTDDDCIVSDDWLAQIIKAFQNNPDVAVIFGSVVDERGVLGGKKGRNLIEDGKFSGRLSKLWFVGDAANRSVKRTVYQTIKGHDEFLGAGAPLLGCEDQDFAYRALKAGFKILTARNIIVYHSLYRVYDIKSYLSILHDYQIGKGACYFKQVRCLDFIALRILFADWIWKVKQIWRFFFSTKHRISTKIPRPVLLLYMWFMYTYWTVLGVLVSLRYPIDKTYCLYGNKR